LNIIITMKTIKKYNLYIFISSFTRNIIDVYSVIYLYQKGISVKNIIAMYSLIYFFGTFISIFSIQLGNKIGYKYILMLSSIVTSISFYILRTNNNLYLISILLSLSMFTYHPIKHYYGIKLLKYKSQIGNTLITTYIAALLSSYIAIKEVNIIYLVIISIIGILPAIFIEKEKTTNITYPKTLPKNKVKFFILDQFKILFLLLEPLYLYILANNLKYVGIFNIILTVSSILCIIILTKKVNLNKAYIYINIFFVIIILIKLNVTNKSLLLLLAFFQGIGIKTNELVSNMNLYDQNKLTKGYIITAEKIFCLTRSLILSIFYFTNFSLRIDLYLLTIGIFLLSSTFHKKRESF
ncbi:MAG: hypothetical protein MR835_04535, partial [Erysipelotrichaceae bacterium]|nr:hypothetical protein [Erysipelotrichaceae bacterium]